MSRYIASSVRLSLCGVDPYSVKLKSYLLVASSEAFGSMLLAGVSHWLFESKSRSVISGIYNLTSVSFSFTPESGSVSF